MELEILYRCLPSTRHVKVLMADSTDPAKERGNIVRIAKEDALKRESLFRISDLKEKRRYYVELLALDEKHEVIDRSYLVADTSKPKIKMEIDVLSGMWTFEKGISFSAISEDRNVYTKLLIEPLKTPRYRGSHECFLIGSGIRQKLCSIAYYYDPAPRIYPSGVVFSHGKAIRTIGLDHRQYESADGVVRDSFPEEVNHLLGPACEFLSADRVKLLFCEFVINKMVKQTTVRDTKGNVEPAVEEYRSIMRKMGDGRITKGLPIEARGVPYVGIFRECRSSYKIFCKEEDKDNLEITLDEGDLYIYSLTLRRTWEANWNRN